MAVPQLLVHDNKDTGGVVVVEGLKKGTDMLCVVTHDNTSFKLKTKIDVQTGNKVATYGDADPANPITYYHRGFKNGEAVANWVGFGRFGRLVYPYLARALLPGSAAIGLFLGTAVHDTSQVVGAALTYRQIYADDAVLRVATVTKLTRNLFLAAVIPLLTWWHARERGATGARNAPASWRSLVPSFVLGFVAFKALFAAALAMVVTPLIARVALADPV